MNYDLCCLDLTQDGKTLVDTELTAVSDLWLAPAGNAAKAKQITAKEPAIGRFSWMPNGSIVFANGDGNLFVVNPDGSGHTLLTPNERLNGPRRFVEMGAISSTPLTGSKRSGYGAWIPTAQTRSGSPTRHLRKAHNVRRTASGWSICGALPRPRYACPSRERNPREVLVQDICSRRFRRCRSAIFENSVAISPDGKRSRISPGPTLRSKTPVSLWI